MSKQVFYVEEWTNQYKIYKVKAKSQADAMNIYWNEANKNNVEVLCHEYLDIGETNIYEEKDRFLLSGWKPSMERGESDA